MFEQLKKLDNYDISTKLMSNNQSKIMVQATIKLFKQPEGNGTAQLLKSVTALAEAETVEKAEDSSVSRALKLLGD